MEMVSGATYRLTRPHLVQAVRIRFPVHPGRIHAAIRILVDKGALCYTYEHGCSFIEPAGHGPVRISPRIVLAPPGVHHPAAAGEVTVALMPGAAFGDGRHPSTRSAVRCLDHVLPAAGEASGSPPATLLDIGTGSGVLLIAGLLLGVATGVGLDTDPCARVEARENLRHNRLTHRAVVSDQPFESVSRRFEMIAANLRFPTLIRLAPAVADRLKDAGTAVLSGIQADEWDAVRSAYEAQKLDPLWWVSEKGWVGAVFRKP